MTSRPAEQEAFIGDGARRQKKGKCAAFMEFLYDGNTGKVLGRSASSWFQITVFYIIFYACLVGFWAACLAVFLQTISYEEPCWYGKGTIIGVNPGMGYQPWMQDDPDSTLIKFNKRNPKTYEKYIKQIEEYLKKYEDISSTRECTGSMTNNDTDVKQTCQFNWKEVDEKKKCSKDNGYGFKDGQPCVIIALNRLIGWAPEKYPEGSLPSELDGRGANGDIAINCEGEYEADQENMGKLSYIPENGLARKYYPYRKAKNYHQPIAMVKFDDPPSGIAMEIECKAYAYNIIHDRSDRQGMVHFELLVDDRDPSEDEDEEDDS